MKYNLLNNIRRLQQLEIISNLNPIQYSDAMPGRGKTTSITNLINQSSNRYIYVQPTIDLGNEIQQGLYGSELIYDIGATSKFNKWQEQNGKGAIITHQNFLMNPKKITGNFNVVIDEDLDIVQEHTLKLSYFHKSFTQFIITKDFNEEYYILTPKKGSKTIMEQIIKNNCGDVIADILRPILYKLINTEKYALFVSKKNWNYITQNKEIDTDTTDDRTIFIQSVLLPTYYQEVSNITILRSNFTNTLHFKVWEAFGINWCDITNKLNLRQLPRKMFNNVNCYYFTHKWNSKNFLNQNNRLELIKNKIIENQNGNKIMMTMNNSFNVQLTENVELTKVRLDGQNKYMEHIDAAYLAATIPTPSYISFMKSIFGFTQKEIYKSIQIEKTFQYFMRTAIRDINGELEDGANFYCVDKDSAKYMQTKFPGAQLIKLDVVLGEDKKIGRPVSIENIVEHKKTYIRQYMATYRKNRKLIEKLK